MIILKSTGGVSKQFPDYIFTTQRITSVVGNLATIDGVVYDLTSLNRTNNSDGIASEVVSEKITDLEFNGRRTVKRINLPAINTETNTVKEFLEEYFFPKLKPIMQLKLTLKSPTELGNYFYFGIKYQIKINASVNPRDETDPLRGFEIACENTKELIISSIQTSLLIESTFDFTNSYLDRDVTFNVTALFNKVNSLVGSIKASFQYPRFYGYLNDFGFSKINKTNTNICVRNSFTEPLTGEITPFKLTCSNQFIYLSIPIIEITQDFLTYSNDASILVTQKKIIVYDNNGFDITSAFSVTLMDFNENIHGLTNPSWTFKYLVLMSNNRITLNNLNYRVVNVI